MRIRLGPFLASYFEELRLVNVVENSDKFKFSIIFGGFMGALNYELYLSKRRILIHEIEYNKHKLHEYNSIPIFMSIFDVNNENKLKKREIENYISIKNNELKKNRSIFDIDGFSHDICLAINSFTGILICSFLTMYPFLSMSYIILLLVYQRNKKN